MESRDPMIQQRRSLIGFAKLIVLHPPDALPVPPAEGQEVGDRQPPPKKTPPRPTPPGPAIIQS